MISIKFRIDRQAEFDPEIQFEVDKRLDFIPINIPTTFRTKQLEITYSEREPLVIMEMGEELRVGTR